MGLIRKIHDQYTFEKIPPEWENQLHVLNKRTNYLKFVMGFSAFGFLFNMLTVLLLYLDLVFHARISFAFMLPLYDFFNFFIFTRIRLSNEALKFHLSDMSSIKKIYNFLFNKFFLNKEIPFLIL